MIELMSFQHYDEYGITCCIPDLNIVTEGSDDESLRKMVIDAICTVMDDEDFTNGHISGIYTGDGRMVDIISNMCVDQSVIENNLELIKEGYVPEIISLDENDVIDYYNKVFWSPTDDNPVE